MPQPARQSNFRDSIKDAFIKKGKELDLNPIIVNSESHPEFHQGIVELTKKYELGYVPHVLVMDGVPVSSEWKRKLPNAAAHPAGVIIITKPMMELTEADIAKPMSAKLETVIAHEISHLKDGPLRVLAQFGLPLAMPAVAVIGLKIYDHAHEKTKREAHQSQDEYLKSLTANIHTVSYEETKNANVTGSKDIIHSNTELNNQLIHEARTMLVAAVGLAAGLIGSRHLSLRGEFRADKNAAEMTGNPELLKDVLTRLTAVFKEARKNKPPEDSFGKIVKEKLHWLMAKTVAAHPSLQQRHNNIDGIGLG